MSEVARPEPFEEATQPLHGDLLEHLARTECMEVGAALVANDNVGAAVLGMVEAGATTEDVLSGLVMAGLLRRRQRWTDRLPLLGRLLTRHSLGFERVPTSDR